MQKIYISLFFCFFLSNVRSQDNIHKYNFIIKGKIKKEKVAVLYLTYQDFRQKWVTDTAIVRSDDSFIFKGQINGATYAFLKGNIASNSESDKNNTVLFLEPGQMIIKLEEGNFKEARTKGSRTQEEFAMLKNQKKKSYEAQSKLSMEVNMDDKKIDGGDSSQALKAHRQSVWDQFLKYQDQDRITDYKFIKSHTDSYLSPYLMNYYFGRRILKIDSAQILFDLFTPTVKKSFYGTSIERQIIARRQTSIGREAPDFSKPDVDGKEVSLGSFKGKSYVLLDFWASWCVPCRVMSPKMIQTYQKYHSRGLEIIGLSWDSDKKQWLDAIQKDNTGKWYNLSANIYLDDDNGMRGKYAISSIPTAILIDVNGKIIGRYLGEGEGDEDALFRDLGNLFNNKK